MFLTVRASAAITYRAVKVVTLGASGAFDIISPSSSYTGGPYNGTPYLHSSIYSSVSINTLNSTEKLVLLGLDIGEYSAFAKTQTVGLTGYRIDGSVVSTTISLDEVFDGDSILNDFQTITFDSNWAGF